METIPIIDIHCHPSLKIYLCNKNIVHKHYPIPDILPSGMHVDLPGMEQGGVQIIFSYHYVPEAGLGLLPKSHRVFDLLSRLGLNIINKFEQNVPGNGCTQQALLSMELLNHQIKRAETTFNVTIPHNLQEFESALTTGKKIIIHCLEGGHHLGKDLPDEAGYTDNLQKLRDAGLCILTIAHFFKNGLCDSGGGIPPKEAGLIGYSRQFVDPPGLTNAGRSVVQWCQNNGVIIDLTHSTTDTRNHVYQMLDERKTAGEKVRPVIFSHTGIREIAAPKMISEDDKLLLPDVTEIKKISDVGGVFGIILMNYWTTGIEEDDPFKKDRGIPFVLDTIDFIFKETGNFDNIAIGTDLDGFTQVPDDVTHIRLIGRLRDAILSKFGAAAAIKICKENALRVIRKGWS